MKTTRKRLGEIVLRTSNVEELSAFHLEELVSVDRFGNHALSGEVEV